MHSILIQIHNAADVTACKKYLSCPLSSRSDREAELVLRDFGLDVEVLDVYPLRVEIWLDLVLEVGTS